MRIAFVYSTYWPYVRRGVERLIHDYAVYLADRGHDVDVITAKPGPGRFEQHGNLTVRYHQFLQHPLLLNYLPLCSSYHFGLLSLADLLRQRYDVLHLFVYSFAFGAPLVRRLQGTPYLFHVIVDDSPWTAGFARSLYERLLRRANVVATLTERSARVLGKRYGCRPVVLPPAVDVQRFVPLGRKDVETPLVLFPADLGDERKGGTLLLRAWTKVHQACPQAKLVLAGPFGFARDTNARAYLEAIPALVPDTAARATIQVPGPGELDELSRWYDAAAVTVLPSIHETFGMIITESLASGTPVVCSDDAGPGEIVDGDRTIGQTVSLRSKADLASEDRAAQLAEAIVAAIALSRNPLTATRCRERAMRWSIERVGQQVERLYSSLTAPSGSREVANALL